jgi:hypothetical protein
MNRLNLRIAKIGGTILSLLHCLLRLDSKFVPTYGHKKQLLTVNSQLPVSTAKAEQQCVNKFGCCLFLLQQMCREEQFAHSRHIGISASPAQPAKG